MSFRTFLSSLLTLALCIGSARGATLANDRWSVEIDPHTLATRATTAEGVGVALSAPREAGRVEALISGDTSASWKNRSEFKKHRERITSHCAFFSPLHRELALLPMSDFAWLTADRQVQRTVFDGKVEMIANFGDKPYEHANTKLPPRSVMSRRLDGAGSPQVFSPAP